MQKNARKKREMNLDECKFCFEARVLISGKQNRLGFVYRICFHAAESYGGCKGPGYLHCFTQTGGRRAGFQGEVGCLKAFDKTSVFIAMWMILINSFLFASIMM